MAFFGGGAITLSTSMGRPRLSQRVNTIKTATKINGKARMKTSHPLQKHSPQVIKEKQPKHKASRTMWWPFYSSLSFSFFFSLRSGDPIFWAGGFQI